VLVPSAGEGSSGQPSFGASPDCAEALASVAPHQRFETSNLQPYRQLQSRIFCAYPDAFIPARLVRRNREVYRSTSFRMASFPADSGPSATPPVLPPKPGSHEASGISTPTPYGSGAGPGGYNVTSNPGYSAQGQQGGQDPNAFCATEQQAPSIPQDPGEHWLPQTLEDKSYVAHSVPLSILAALGT
jgi:hypothetical protein